MPRAATQLVVPNVEPHAVGVVDLLAAGGLGRGLGGSSRRPLLRHLTLGVAVVARLFHGDPAARESGAGGGGRFSQRLELELHAAGPARALVALNEVATLFAEEAHVLRRRDSGGRVQVSVSTTTRRESKNKNKRA